ncbi:MAG: disulfide bond formation protein DsbA [Chryseobacterium sp.]|jgi:protein-disulfide isomerase|uniref:DsbA family protein n=1 Tax=Chryseobacterium sp. TaxID=1871047 RepID=UPI0026157316|nr:thioredoxin domain-containing protein [Chryseobacterium sp.]MDF2553012.1 disulfide bond formation protein DsbA [Chryseobacterium sp.]MDF2934363.1 disulfide bond formation protein DsbA [Chryseobacterium sp.]
MSLTIPVNENDHIVGDPNTAKIVLVEYGDYECAHCGDAFPIVKKFVDENIKEVAFVFRNFPLKDAHPNAMAAAVTAEAASKQGKFWEMHDLIFQNHGSVDKESLEELVKTVGLDDDILNEDIKSDELQKKIEEDFESGVRSGVNGTPSFFVNGEKWEGYDGTEASLSSLLSN